MSGQISTALSLCMKEDWGFTNRPRNVETAIEGFKLEGMVQTWRAGIYYGTDSDSERVRKNLIALSQFPCWPNPSTLIKMIDRHRVAQDCSRKGFFGQDWCVVGTWDEYVQEYGRECPCDTVLKTGNQHSGEGKFLYPAGSQIGVWEGKATVQPFFRGKSVRILHVDNAMYSIETKHPMSWIKNSPGGENVLFDPNQIPEGMIDHSFKVRDHFGLDVCGNDYIICDDGSFHFLETNQFPGLDDDFVRDHARNFFLERMRSLETLVSRNEDILRPSMPSAR